MKTLNRSLFVDAPDRPWHSPCLPHAAMRTTAARLDPGYTGVFVHLEGAKSTASHDTDRTGCADTKSGKQQLYLSHLGRRRADFSRGTLQKAILHESLPKAVQPVRQAQKHGNEAALSCTTQIQWQVMIILARTA